MLCRRRELEEVEDEAAEGRRTMRKRQTEATRALRLSSRLLLLVVIVNILTVVSPSRACFVVSFRGCLAICI